MAAMDLENILCQIDPNHHILHLAVLLLAWLSTPRPWHSAMPSGRAATTPSVDVHPVLITDAARETNAVKLSSVLQ